MGEKKQRVREMKEGRSLELGPKGLEEVEGVEGIKFEVKSS